MTIKMEHFPRKIPSRRHQNPDWDQARSTPGSERAPVLASNDLLSKQGLGYPQAANTPRTEKATNRIPDQRFGQDRRRDSYASDIIGGSDNRDPFRKSMRDGKPPSDSPFAEQSREYHNNQEAATKAEKDWKSAKPGPDRRRQAGMAADSFGEGKAARKQMQNNWPGYQDQKEFDGHSNRIKVVGAREKTYRKKAGS